MPTLKNNSGPEKKNPIPTKSRPVSDTGRIGEKSVGRPAGDQGPGGATHGHGAVAGHRHGAGGHRHPVLAGVAGVELLLAGAVSNLDRLSLPTPQKS